MIIISPPNASDEEAAAIVAAISCALADEQEAEPPAPRRDPWRESGRLLVQDITPARLPTPTWGSIERLRRLRGRAYRI